MLTSQRGDRFSCSQDLQVDVDDALDFLHGPQRDGQEMR